MENVLLDTTVFCAAILTPGVNYKLLQPARSAELFEPVVSEVVVCEFIEHCRKGLKGIVYSEEEIDDFFGAVEPVLNFENIRRIGIGKESWVHLKDLKLPRFIRLGLTDERKTANNMPAVHSISRRSVGSLLSIARNMLQKYY